MVVAGQCCRARGRGRPLPSASSGNVSLSISIAFSASTSARVRLCIWLARSHRPLRGVACPPRARRAEKSVPAGTPAGDPDDERRDPKNNIAAAAAAKRRHCDQVCATYPMLRKGSESRFRSVPSSGCDRRGNPRRELFRHSGILFACLPRLVECACYLWGLLDPHLFSQLVRLSRETKDLYVT